MQRSHRSQYSTFYWGAELKHPFWESIFLLKIYSTHTSALQKFKRLGVWRSKVWCGPPMRPSMSGETLPTSSFVVPFDVPSSFIHHFSTRPLGLVRLTFTELRKSIVSHYVSCSLVAESRSTDVRHASYVECTHVIWRWIFSTFIRHTTCVERTSIGLRISLFVH